MKSRTSNWDWLPLVVLLTACGGGGGSSTSGTPVPSAEAITRGEQALMMRYEGVPATNLPLTLHIESHSAASPVGVECFLKAQPPGSDVPLVVAAETLSATLTPIAAGDYRVMVMATVAGDAAAVETGFTVRPTLLYDPAKVMTRVPGTPLEEVIGRVVNQMFVYSPFLDESGLRALLQGYPLFTVIGYSDIEGLLFEFDELAVGMEAEIQRLKGESRVTSVVYRVHEGENAPSTLRVPNDGSEWFTQYPIRLYYADQSSQRLGCGKGSNWFGSSGDDDYSGVRALRATTGSFSAGHFQNAQATLSELLNNAAAAGVGAECP